MAYQLVRALAIRSAPDVPLAPEQYLDLVAIGTVADMVPLLGREPVLVRAGLRR